jgi:hypothetical protein
MEEIKMMYQVKMTWLFNVSASSESEASFKVMNATEPSFNAMTLDMSSEFCYENFQVKPVHQDSPSEELGAGVDARL